MTILAERLYKNIPNMKFMSTLLKIDSIMFCVKDVEKASHFYEDVLGLNRAWTDNTNKMIGFIFDESDSEIVIHSDPTIPNPSFSFLVKDVEKFCKEYTRKGYHVVHKPFDVRCGKYAVLSDPDGNEIPIIDLTAFGNEPKYDLLGAARS